MYHCYHLYWFLFGSYRGVVLVLVVLVMMRPRSPKTVFMCLLLSFRCRRFCRSIYAEGFTLPFSSKISLPWFQYSHLLLGSICHPLSNKSGFVSFGLHLQMIRFSDFQLKGLPFIFWFFHILLNNYVSMHNIVELVVTIPTSPRLSETE